MRRATDVFSRTGTTKVAFLVAFLLLPFFAYGSIFSFIDSLSLKNLFGEEKPENSQTIVLLEAPRSFDSKNNARGGGEITVVGGMALLPDSGPSGTLAEIDELPADGGQISIYVVRKGDSLGSIAKMFGVTVNTIVWANDLYKADIKPGQTLIILPVTGIQHKVVKGDTVEKIAKKYKTDVKEILSFNDLSLSDELAIGEEILIPDGALEGRNIISTPRPGQFVSGRASRPLFVFYQNEVGSGYFIRPVAGAHKTQGLHGYNGIDLGAPTGTAIMAAAAGTVVIARDYGYNGGYGKYVVIQHDNGTQTLYGHNSKVYVRAGDIVNQGQTIAAVGNTGRSTGSHLHFEVRGAKNPF